MCKKVSFKYVKLLNACVRYIHKFFGLFGRCMSGGMSVCLSIGMFRHLHLCLYISMSISIFVCPSVHSHIHWYICTSTITLIPLLRLLFAFFQVSFLKYSPRALLLVSLVAFLTCRTPGCSDMPDNMVIIIPPRIVPVLGCPLAPLVVIKLSSQGVSAALMTWQSHLIYLPLHGGEGFSFPGSAPPSDMVNSYFVVVVKPSYSAVWSGIRLMSLLTHGQQIISLFDHTFILVSWLRFRCSNMILIFCDLPIWADIFLYL